MTVILSKLLSFKEFSLFVMLSNKNYIDLARMLDRFCDGCLIKQSISILGSSGVRPFDVGFKKPTSGYRLNSPLIRGSCLVNEYEPCLSHAG